MNATYVQVKLYQDCIQINPDVPFYFPTNGTTDSCDCRILQLPLDISMESVVCINIIVNNEERDAVSTTWIIGTPAMDPASGTTYISSLSEDDGTCGSPSLSLIDAVEIILERLQQIDPESVNMYLKTAWLVFEKAEAVLYPPPIIRNVLAEEAAVAAMKASVSVIDPYVIKALQKLAKIGQRAKVKDLLQSANYAFSIGKRTLGYEILKKAINLMESEIDIVVPSLPTEPWAELGKLLNILQKDTGKMLKRTSEALKLIQQAKQLKDWHNLVWTEIKVLEANLKSGLESFEDGKLAVDIFEMNLEYHSDSLVSEDTMIKLVISALNQFQLPYIIILYNIHHLHFNRIYPVKNRFATPIFKSCCKQ